MRPAILVAAVFAIEATAYAFDASLGNLVCVATPVAVGALVWLTLDVWRLRGPLACILAGFALGLGFGYANFYFARWAMVQLGHVDGSWGLAALFGVLIVVNLIVGATTGFVFAVARYKPAD
jgi:hypothetical protein